MSLENILDATLDDLADAPSIQLFPNGAHKVSLGFKIDDTKVSVQVIMTYVEPVELADPTAAAPLPGDKNYVFLNLKKKDGSANTFAQGTLKDIVKVLAPVFPGNSTRETLSAAEGVEVIVLTKIRKGTGDYEGRDNIDLVKIELA